jgi:hypothetical protein
MSGEIIDSLKRAYAEALYEGKRHDMAAEAIATAIRCLSGEKVAPPAKPQEIEMDWPAPTAVATVDPEKPAKGAAVRRMVKALNTREAIKAEKAAPRAMQTRPCVICGKVFKPNSPVKKTCSPECVKEKNRRYALAKYHTNVNIRKATASKGPAAANKAPVKAPAPVSRVDRIKAACARVDALPQSVLDAAAEARESGALNG